MTDFTNADFLVTILLAAIAAFGIWHARTQSLEKPS